MKRFILPLVASVFMITPSCSTIQSAREKLAEMPEAEYDQLVGDVHAAGIEAGHRLADLIDDPDTRRDAVVVAQMLWNAVANDQIDVSDIVGYLVDRFGMELQLDEDEAAIVRSAANAIDAVVGQISLGIDGQLTLREKNLIGAFLAGLAISLN